FFYFIHAPRQTPPLFPYTTLFRSHYAPRRGIEHRVHSRAHAGDRDRPERPRVEEERLVGRVAQEEPLAQHDRVRGRAAHRIAVRSEEHTSELQSLRHLVCRLLLEK